MPHCNVTASQAPLQRIYQCYEKKNRTSESYIFIYYIVNICHKLGQEKHFVPFEIQSTLDISNIDILEEFRVDTFHISLYISTHVISNY